MFAICSVIVFSSFLCSVYCALQVMGFIDTEAPSQDWTLTLVLYTYYRFLNLLMNVVCCCFTACQLVSGMYWNLYVEV